MDDKDKGLHRLCLIVYCIVSKQMVFVSSYIMFSLSKSDKSIKMSSIIWIGSTSVDIGSAYLMNLHRKGRPNYCLVYIAEDNHISDNIFFRTRLGQTVHNK